ncbi:MAG: hypothetical protein ABW166_20225 [Sedimenticola sp.]
MTERSPELLLRLLDSKGAVTFGDLQEALNNASRPTTFRYLRQIPYLRSYNHNGRYYTRRDPTLFDRFGLYSLREIHFSREGSLGNTIKRLIRESEAGWTHRELQELLHVRVQVLLLEAVRHEEIQREKVDGFYLYLHADSTVGKPQLQRRLQRIAAQQTNEGEVIKLEDGVIIQVLLTLIRHPGAQPADVVRLLHGHSPPVPMVLVASVFSRYDLESIGKKGGATIS